MEEPGRVPHHCVVFGTEFGDNWRVDRNIQTLPNIELRQLHNKICAVDVLQCLVAQLQTGSHS